MLFCVADVHDDDDLGYIIRTNLIGTQCLQYLGWRERERKEALV